MTDQNTNQNTTRRRGTSPASDPLPEGENNAIGGLLIRGHDGQSINWSATIQDLFSNLSKYLDLFIKAIADPVGYQNLARAIGIKTAANNEPARSTHGDRNVRPTQPEAETPDQETPAAETEQQEPERDIEDILNPHLIDETEYAHSRPVADDVFEHSPALAAASLKFNNHFEAAVAGPQAQEPGMALDLTNLPTLGRVA